MKFFRRRCLYTLLAVTLGAVTAQADVALPKILSDNMVLQRELPVPIWGTAAPGEEIAVRFAGQEKKTKAGADGRWTVSLDALKASATPQELTIAGTNTVTLKNILVGEVWLCSGQSNMEYSINRPSSSAPAAVPVDPQLAQEIATETYPAIRLFRVEKQTRTPDLVTNGWTECSGDALSAFSALGFFFGRNLQHELNVPVGLIESSWGGSRIEPWTFPNSYAGLPAFNDANGQTLAQIDGVRPGQYINSMIRPLVPFAVRGVIWYQGESNIIATNDGIRYADKMQALVEGWRAAWNRTDLPFYSVQIAPYAYTKRPDPLKHSAEEEPMLWEAQWLSTQLPNTGLVPTIDLNADFSNIHPGQKRVVGKRLADLALAEAYGKTGLVYDGPTFAKMEIADGKATLRFTNTGGGLAARDGQPLSEFEIAGADGNFVAAQATLADNTVVVSSAQIAVPVAVRFGWRETAQPNLINKEGLPAYPFRTNGPDWHPATRAASTPAAPVPTPIPATP